MSKLEGLTYLTGFTFADLPESRQRKINNRSIRGIVLNEHADEQARFDLFERINTGSKIANKAEVRRGALTGPFMKLVSDLAKQPNFKILAPVSENREKERGRDELVTRFFAYGDGLDGYKDRPAEFLFNYVKRMNDQFSAGEQNTSDPLHMSASLSELNFSRIKASSAGGTWRDWPIELLADCHRKASGATYPSVYGRMEWDKPAPTITTQCFGYGNGRFGHPEQNRAISLREAAILQTFPADYKFAPEGSELRFNQMGRLIGNAVPVRLGEAIAKSFLTHINAYASSGKLN